MKYNEKKIDPDPTSSDPGPDDGLGSRMMTRNAGSATQRVTPGQPGHGISPELLPNFTFCLLRKIKIVLLYYFKCLYIWFPCYFYTTNYALRDDKDVVTLQIFFKNIFFFWKLKITQ